MAKRRLTSTETALGWLGAGLCGTGIVSGGVLVLVGFCIGPPPGIWLCVPAAALAFCFPLILLANNLNRRSVERLRDNGFQYCSECAYDLRDRADDGTCPECGVRYRKEQLPAHWRCAYRHHFQPQKPE